MKRVVIKLGTSTLTKGTKQLSRHVMLEMARQAFALYEKGLDVVIVTSGAVAAGREILQFPKLDPLLPNKQMLASVGQVHLMHIWKEMFAIFGVAVGQVLLTRSDFTNRNRYLNMRDTFSCLLKHRVIPIINENDTVATEEVKVGDNDNLSAHVANLIAADLLILLTDQQGLFTADPRSNPDATLISEVAEIDDTIVALAGGAAKALGLGTGGMMTKIEAARLATQGGIPALIASSAISDVLIKIYSGEKIGTYFKAPTTPRESRKRWLLSEKPQGCIDIDLGACNKLLKDGASLLAVGVKKVTMPFERGSIIQINSLENKPIAIGITNYSSQDIEKIMGKQSDEIEKVLSYSYGDAIIHRDNMVVVK